MRLSRLLSASAIWATVGLWGAGCDTPPTTVAVIENDYPTEPTGAKIVYRARWQAVSFEEPVAPGESSTPTPTVPASAQVAYALLAPGWNPLSVTAPSSLVAIVSRGGFEAHLSDRLRIAVDATLFVGDCSAGISLDQSEADFITGVVFAELFVGVHYDAATCQMSPAP